MTDQGDRSRVRARRVPMLDRLQPEDYQKFLDWIGQDAVDAWQARLERYFETRMWNQPQRTTDASELASETLDRTAAKFGSAVPSAPRDVDDDPGDSSPESVDESRQPEGRQAAEEETPGPPSGPVGPYLYAVARLVWFEARRRPVLVMAELDRLPVVAVVSERPDCFTRCLEPLGDVDRAVLYDYYAGARQAEGDRKRIRKDIRRDAHLSSGALRIKVFRLKRKVARCLQACREEQPTPLHLVERTPDV